MSSHHLNLLCELDDRERVLYINRIITDILENERYGIKNKQSIKKKFTVEFVELTRIFFNLDNQDTRRIIIELISCGGYSCADKYVFLLDMFEQAKKYLEYNEIKILLTNEYFNENLSTLLKNHPNIENIINQLMMDGYEEILVNDENVVNMIINKKIQMTNTFLNILICEEIYDKNDVVLLVKLLPIKKKDYKKIFEYACIALNYQLIEFLLENDGKIVENCFGFIFNKGKYLRTYKNSYDDIIELFLKHDYKISRDDLLSATKSKYTIENFKAIEHLKLDNKFANLCSEVGFYPSYNQYSYIITSCLEKECTKSDNMKLIRIIMDNTKIIPTEKCFENACKIKNNDDVVSYLLNFNIDIKMDYLKLYCKANFDQNHTLNKLLNKCHGEGFCKN